MRAHINATRGAEPWSQMRHPTVQRASPGSLSCLNLYLLELPVQNTNVYCPCRTSRGLFLLARSRFGESLLAWGQRLTVSVEPCPPQIFCDYIPYPWIIYGSLIKAFHNAGTDISTSPLAPASEFVKKGLSGKYISVFTSQMGKLYFWTLNTFFFGKWPRYPELCKQCNKTESKMVYL